jgi:gamma-glutamylcysteine synthetase
MGRPLLELDEEQIEELAAMFCTMKEIAAVMGCNVDTLHDRFSDVIAKGRDRGKMTLRKQQWKAANNGNVVMLIWLGKQYLEQQDKTQLVLEKVPDEILIQEAQRRIASGSKS